MKEVIEDVQSRPDTRAIALDAAGVRGLKHPFTLVTSATASQPVVAELAMSAAAAAEAQGTHTSRCVASAATVTRLAADGNVELAREVHRRLFSPNVDVEARFTFILLRHAPVTGAPGWIDYRGALACNLNAGIATVTTSVHVPVTTLCPCSKAISAYGAHNQRGVISIAARHDGGVHLEELVAIAESCGSSPVYAVLKRPDERAVTMQAYDTPMFVEDIVRCVVEKLRADARIASADIAVVNDESIHNHQAFAETRYIKNGPKSPPIGNA